jgi:hypothetical protein
MALPSSKRDAQLEAAQREALRFVKACGRVTFNMVLIQGSAVPGITDARLAAMVMSLEGGGTVATEDDYLGLAYACRD